MPITLGRANNHIESWTARLARFESRVNWPRSLFHTCDLSVAVEVLRCHSIYSRNRAAASVGLICDVANQGALWNNPAAHDYVRLYFRPRNPFHLKTEDIKSSTDHYRCNPHMSIPVAFAFSFEQVMTLPSCRFLAENFALSSSEPLDGDEAFSLLNFEYIYHDSAPPRDIMNLIHRARMAEVVVPETLSLQYCSAIIVRNEYDRRTLLYALNGGASPINKLVVEQRGGTFMRRGIALDEVSVAGDDLILSFSGPASAAQEDYDVVVQHGEAYRHHRLAAGKRWLIKTGTSFQHPVRIDIEGCLAFFAHVPAGRPIVV